MKKTRSSVRTPKKGAPAAVRRPHPDSVIVEEDVVDVTPVRPSTGKALARVSAAPPPVVALAAAEGPTASAAAARRLVLDAKSMISQVYARRGMGAGGGTIRLDLETDDEVNGAMWLEHQGKGSLYQVGGCWVFEFKEDSDLMGGVLAGNVVAAKEHEKDWG